MCILHYNIKEASLPSMETNEEIMVFKVGETVCLGDLPVNIQMPSPKTDEYIFYHLLIGDILVGCKD